jgi:hypothetical protein
LPPKFGPKVKLTLDRLAHARKLIQQGTRPTDAAKIIGIGRTTLYSARRLEAMRDITQSDNVNHRTTWRLMP